MGSETRGNAILICLLQLSIVFILTAYREGAHSFFSVFVAGKGPQQVESWESRCGHQ